MSFLNVLMLNANFCIHYMIIYCMYVFLPYSVRNGAVRTVLQCRKSDFIYFYQD